VTPAAQAWRTVAGVLAVGGVAVVVAGLSAGAAGNGTAGFVVAVVGGPLCLAVASVILGWAAVAAVRGRRAHRH
jgi:hypothetical protein